MPLAERFHGTRVLQGPAAARPIATEDYSTIGAIVVAPNADPVKYPLNVATTIFTGDNVAVAALGAGGNVDAVIDAINDQADAEFGSAEVQIVRVAEGAGANAQAILEATIANIVGSGATLSGVHAFKVPEKKAKLYIAPGYTSQRIANAANPVVSELIGITGRNRGITIADMPNTTKEAAATYRADFADGKRIYGIDPHVLVSGAGGTPVVQPASGRVAGLFVRRDKKEGGPHVSPSNQQIGGIVGTARPVPYYMGDPDSEANWLNQNNIATIRRGGRLWGNDTFALDPLYRYVNVVRTEDAIDDAVAKAFEWAMDANVNVPLAVAIVRSLDAFLTDAAVRGWIISGKVTFDPAANSNANMVAGQLTIDYDREPYAPLNDLQFRASRNPDYYTYVTDGITRAVEQINAKTRRLIYGVNLGA
ncbi:MAG TPA: phage tail protein [Accumulibacter sp.]|nr:phage tail protein [Accumulibacter sp.]